MAGDDEEIDWIHLTLCTAKLCDRASWRLITMLAQDDDDDDAEQKFDAGY